MYTQSHAWTSASTRLAKPQSASRWMKKVVTGKSDSKTINWNKNTSTSHHAPYRFMWTKFGLRNASSTVDQPTNVAFLAVRSQLSVVHLYDIVVLSPSAAEHIQHIKHIWPFLRHAGVTFNLKTCNFSTGIIDHFRRVFRLNGLEFASHTTDAIENSKPLEILTNWNHFTVFVSFQTVCTQFCENCVFVKQWTTKGPAVQLRAAREKARCDVESATELDFSANIDVIVLRGANDIECICLQTLKWCVLLRKELDNTKKLLGYSSFSLTSSEFVYYFIQRECTTTALAVQLHYRN